MSTKGQILFSLFFLSFLFISCNQSTSTEAPAKQVDSNAIDWMTLEQAEAASLKNPKPIYVMVYANWCPHCKNFDKTTYKEGKVIDYINANYYPVKLDAHSNETITYRSEEYTNPNYDDRKTENELNSYHEVLYAIEAKSIPSIVFIDKDFNVTGTELGYKDANELRSLMAMYNN